MKKFNTVTGEELLSKEIPEIPFVIKDLIPTGLTLLAGSAMPQREVRADLGSL